jgi:hypothetical protein
VVLSDKVTRLMPAVVAFVLGDDQTGSPATQDEADEP